MIKKIVIACDSFKGCLNSEEVALAAADGVRRVHPECSVAKVAVADGGEGTAGILVKALGGRAVTAYVSDPLGRQITAEYGIAEMETETGSEDAIGCKVSTAIIEMAQASGLTLLAENERNPLDTSTFGTGEMILDALNKGCRRFLIGIGGSATNDGGTGMLEALGVRFLDKTGKVIKGCCGKTLSEIASIDDSNLDAKAKESTFVIACDVTTPFCGEDGATKIFAPQKGASIEDISILETGMASLNKIIREKKGIDLGKMEGTGAAGGIGGAFKAFLNARLMKGVDMVLDSIGFDDIVKDADLVITGEGRIDSQSSKGKLIYGVLSRAERFNVPVIAIGGIIDIGDDPATEENFKGIYAIAPRPQNESDLRNAMRPEVATKNISDTVVRALEELFPSSCHGNL